MRERVQEADRGAELLPPQTLVCWWGRAAAQSLSGPGTAPVAMHQQQLQKGGPALMWLQGGREEGTGTTFVVH